MQSILFNKLSTTNSKSCMYITYLVYCLMIFSSLSACHIYRSDLRQGTYLKQQQLDQLKAGLTKQQVKEILGTSALEEIDASRMDYYYSFSPNQDGITEQQHLILYFDSNQELHHYEGDFQLRNLPTTTQNIKKYPPRK